MGFFEKLVAGLGKTRDNIVSGMDSIFHGFSRIDDDFYEELEEVLEFPEAYRETLVVLDATTGQNALQQAKEFNDVAEITGIVLTKMDGTAKGGIAVAIHAELGVPVKYIGVGETIDDLQKFNADDFVNALFERPKDDEASEEVSENE